MDNALRKEVEKREGRVEIAAYLRNFIFGVEDSLVSTVGLLSGIASANVPRATIFLTGLILVFVEAFSMAAGSFLSEHSAEDYLAQREVALRNSALGGIIMFFSYFLTGFIPLFPYIIFSIDIALPTSIILSLIALFILGLLSAKLSRTRFLRSALRMLIIGGVAIILGVTVGNLVNGK